MRFLLSFKVLRMSLQIEEETLHAILYVARVVKEAVVLLFLLFCFWQTLSSSLVMSMSARFGFRFRE